MFPRILFLAGLCLPALPATSAHAQQTSSAEIDAQVWAPLRASVRDADIVAMGKAYHPAAVLVTRSGTRAISSVLGEWGQGMATARRDGTRAEVELRFDHRQDDATTAFETGAFRYTTTDRAGKATSGYTRMETLLVKTGGRWVVMMERQLDPITVAEWDRLPH